MAKRPTEEQLSEKNIISTAEKKKETTRKKNFLSSFFSSRVSKSNLESSQIIKAGVFGVALEELMPDNKIPSFLQNCINHLKLCGLFEEGLFRMSGNSSEISKLRRAFETDEPIELESFNNHSISAVIKKFFLELPIPLFPFAKQEKFCETLGINDVEEKRKTFQILIRSLPQAHQTVADFLFSFLHLLSKYYEKNLMNSLNLGISFGPILLWGEQIEVNSQSDFKIDQKSSEVVIYLVDNYPTVFK